MEGFHHKSYENKERKFPKPAKTRVGCKAIMSLKKKEETWIVTKFVDNHNHELHLTPRSTSLLLGHKVISRAKKNIKDILNELDVPTRKIMSMLSKEFDGDYKVGYVVVDIQNYLGNKRRKLLQDGDAHKVFKLGPFIEP